MKSRKKHSDENGAAIVEMAVISPLLFLILFGIIEGSLLLYDKAVLTNACREGAREGIVFADPRRTDGEIAAVVASYCSDHLVSFSTDAALSVSVARTGTGSTSGDSLTVTVQYPYQFLALAGLSRLFGDGIGGTVTLGAESIMRLE